MNTYIVVLSLLPLFQIILVTFQLDNLIPQCLSLFLQVGDVASLDVQRLYSELKSNLLVFSQLFLCLVHLTSSIHDVLELHSRNKFSIRLKGRRFERNKEQRLKGRKFERKNFHRLKNFTSKKKNVQEHEPCRRMEQQEQLDPSLR